MILLIVLGLLASFVSAHAAPSHEPNPSAEGFRLQECDAEAIATIFEPCLDGTKVSQRRTGRLCKQCLSYHPEIYDTIYEDMCISGMKIESIKKDFAKLRN